MQNIQRVITGIGLCIALQLRAAGPVKTFTDMEVNHIRVKTSGLFHSSKQVSLHLEKLAENEYAFPLPGAKVISGYGKYSGRHSHSGIDIKTKANDTIRCAFNGTVHMSKSYSGYGKVIVVRHPNGLETVYSHNSRNLVLPGEEVKAGQAIALTGRTGRATTEHLHFETRINGEHFNPDIIFNMKDCTLRKETIVCSQSAKGIIIKPKK